MFKAQVYIVMIGSLSGSIEEVFTAKEVVRQWNHQNSEAKGQLYLPVEWTTKPKEIKNVDVVIGIVGNWVSDQDFIQGCFDSGKKVVLLFNDFQDPHNTILSEYDAVLAFKRSVYGHCVCVEYKDKAHLSSLLNDQLSNYAIYDK